MIDCRKILLLYFDGISQRTINFQHGTRPKYCFRSHSASESPRHYLIERHDANVWLEVSSGLCDYNVKRKCYQTTVWEGYTSINGADLPKIGNCFYL